MIYSRFSEMLVALVIANLLSTNRQKYTKIQDSRYLCFLMIMDSKYNFFCSVRTLNICGTLTESSIFICIFYSITGLSPRSKLNLPFHFRTDFERFKLTFEYDGKHWSGRGKSKTNAFSSKCTLAARHSGVNPIK